MTLGISFVLAVTIAFFAGTIFAGSRSLEPLVIEVPDTVLRLPASEEGSLLDLALPDALKKTSAGEGIPEAERKGAYVASSQGKYYYDPAMAQAGRLKPSNRVWFASRAEAEARGYKPIKGLPAE